MKLRLQFGGGLLALGLSAAMALPSAAQSHNNRPPQQQRQPHAPRQTNRPPQQPGGRPQNKPPKNDGPHHNATPNRPSPYQQTESMGMIGGDRLQNMPESARNQHLSDANFTRGMSEEDKALLRDLSHMHVGAPDSAGE